MAVYRKGRDTVHRRLLGVHEKVVGVHKKVVEEPKVPKAAERKWEGNHFIAWNAGW